MSTQVIIDTPMKASVTPSDIPLRDSGCVGRFGKCEVEETAGNLVRFFQKRGSWGTFTNKELQEYYQSIEEDPGAMFFGLKGTWHDEGGSYNPGNDYIVEVFSGVFAVTQEFIDTCLKT